MLKDLEDIHLKSTATLRKQETEFRERLGRLEARVTEETTRQATTEEALDQERSQRTQAIASEKSSSTQALADLRAQVERLRASVADMDAKSAQEENRYVSFTSELSGSRT